MLGQLVTGRQKESGVTKNLVRSRHLRGIQGGPPGGTFRYTLYIIIYTLDFIIFFKSLFRIKSHKHKHLQCGP